MKKFIQKLGLFLKKGLNCIGKTIKSMEDCMHFQYRKLRRMIKTHLEINYKENAEKILKNCLVEKKKNIST